VKSPILETRCRQQRRTYRRQDDQLSHRALNRTPITLTPRRLIANSHRHARHDETVLSASRSLRRCEMDSRQLKTVTHRQKKNEVGTRSEQSSNSHRHIRHNTDRTVLSCLAGGVNWAQYAPRVCLFLNSALYKLLACLLTYLVFDGNFLAY